MDMDVFVNQSLSYKLKDFLFGFICIIDSLKGEFKCELERRKYFMRIGFMNG